MPRRISIRWTVLLLLVAYSFVVYVQRLNISVAAAFMMPELGLTEVQMGWVFSAFLWGYALFQMPTGMLGDRFGPRRVLATAAVVCAGATLLTALLPGIAFTSTLAIIGSLVAVRFLLGVAQAPTFPVAAATIARWFPAHEWALPNALLGAGIGLGAAFTPGLVAWLMTELGWRESFYLTMLPALIIAAIFWKYLRDRPEEHEKVEEEELTQVKEGRPEAVVAGVEAGHWTQLIRNREVLLLTLSYMSYNYVFYIFFFWFFIYLVDVRGFTILEGGIAAGLPFLVGGLTSIIGGRVCDRLSLRIGPRAGYRTVAVIGLVGAALLLYWGAVATNPYVAVVALSLCFGFTQFTEGPFWAGATRVAGPYTGTATGIMNTGGNLGGVIATPLVPIIAERFSWLAALGTGSFFALLAAALWMMVRVDRPVLEEWAHGNPPEDRERVAVPGA
jgi:MFS transporter, ACS family, glucarate transporter